MKGLLLIAMVLLDLFLLTRAGDKPQVLVSTIVEASPEHRPTTAVASPACAAPKLQNPCDRMVCKVRPQTWRYA